jgi:hypothetical protein
MVNFRVFKIKCLKIVINIAVDKLKLILKDDDSKQYCDRKRSCWI